MRKPLISETTLEKANFANVIRLAHSLGIDTTAVQNRDALIELIVDIIDEQRRAHFRARIARFMGSSVEE